MKNHFYGLYRAKDPETLEEYHGGAIIREDVYWYLAFHGMEVGLYGSGPNDRRRYDRREYEFAGRITGSTDDVVHFYVYNPQTRSNVHFEATILNNDRLHIRQLDHNKGIKGIFERQE